jgi:hypothetical protein
VRRQSWNGDTHDIFMPLGPVPKSQRFSLSANKSQRAEILNFLAAKGIFIQPKMKQIF